MNLKDRMIIEEYRKSRADFLKIGDIVQNKLSEIAKEHDIDPLAIEHRVKKEESLVGKLYRKGDRYSSLSDLTDIMGARVICFFSDEVDAFGRAVEEFFNIDWENSCDKRSLIGADSFGYLSVHYICSLPENAGYPEELCNKKFEIQIRTGLQHIWAVINHDIGYKSSFGVPRAITREFSRLAGLLELADEEFVRTRDSMNSYTEDIREKIAENRADDVAIDMISLNEYVLRNGKMHEFMEQLASIEGSEINYINPEIYIEQLNWLGIKNLGDMQNALERDRELAYRLAKQSLEGTELDILSSNVGLRFICRAELLNGGYTVEKAAEFLTISIGDAVRAQRQAKRLFDVYEKLKGEDT